MKGVVVFTNRGLGRLIEERGSKAWKLDPDRVLKLTYIVCVQNRNDGDWGQPSAEQGEGFLIGKINGVEAITDEKGNTRYIVRFDEYAEISIRNFWEKLGGLRNPVRYIEKLEEHVDLSTLVWKSVDKDGEPRVAAPVSSQRRGEDIALDMAGAKQALSQFYKVPVSAIEITIRG